MSPDKIPLIFELVIIFPIIVLLFSDFIAIVSTCKKYAGEAADLLSELRQESETLQKLSIEFFQSPKTFAPKPADKRVYDKLNLATQLGDFAATKAKAQSLVFIGLIGTVIGISISTSLLAFGVRSANGNPTVIVNEMSKMLTTLPVAFVVTFVAVSLSVVSNRKTHAVISLQNTVEDLCIQNNNVRTYIAQGVSQSSAQCLLERISVLIDPTRNMSHLSDSIDVLTDTTKALRNQQSMLISALNQIAEPVAKASDGLIIFGTSMDASVDKLVPAADRVAGTMSSIRETTGVIDKAYEKLFSVSDRLENVAAYLVSDAFRASSQVIGEMTVGQNQFLSKMDKSLDAQIQLIQQSVGQQQALHSNFMQLIAAYESMQRDQMPAVSELKNAVQTQSALSTKLADQASTIADSTRKLSETIDQGNTELKEAMSSTNSTMATMINALNAMLERFNSIPFWPNWPGSKSGNRRDR
jgi:hypothetical protein